MPPSNTPGQPGGHLLTVPELGSPISPGTFLAGEVSVGQVASGELKAPGEPPSKQGPELESKHSRFQALNCQTRSSLRETPSWSQSYPWEKPSLLCLLYLVFSLPCLTSPLLHPASWD